MLALYLPCLIVMSTNIVKNNSQSKSSLVDWSLACLGLEHPS